MNCLATKANRPCYLLVPNFCPFFTKGATGEPLFLGLQGQLRRTSTRTVPGDLERWFSDRTGGQDAQQVHLPEGKQEALEETDKSKRKTKHDRPAQVWGVMFFPAQAWHKQFGTSAPAVAGHLMAWEHTHTHTPSARTPNRRHVWRSGCASGRDPSLCPVTQGPIQFSEAPL